MIIENRLGEETSSVFTELDKELKKREAQCLDCINFSIGTPDLPPPEHIMGTIIRESSVVKNYRYAISDLPELLDAAVLWYKTRYNVELVPHQVQSLMGSQEGLAHAALALTKPGDIVLTPDPGYPIFHAGPMIAGAKVVRVPLDPKNGWRMELDAIPEETARAAKLIIVSYPNNPTATVAPQGFYEELVCFAKKYDVMVIHDNAYSELTFDGMVGESFLATPGAVDVGIEFNSLSKTWNIPGCRISFALGNTEMIAAIRGLKSHLDYGMFFPFQKAAIAALSGSWDFVANVRATYERRRNLLCESFSEAGWLIPKSTGTMFVWAPLPGGRRDSLQFTLDLIENTGVIVVPGVSFGERGEGYVRIALVQSEEKIMEAAKQIKEYLHR